MALYKYHYIELDTKRSPRISLQNIVAGETGNRIWITVTNNGDVIDMSAKEDDEFIYRVALRIDSDLGTRRQDSAQENSGITFIEAATGDHGKINILLSKDSFTAGMNRARIEIFSKRAEDNDTLIISAEWTFRAAGNPTGENAGSVYPSLIELENELNQLIDDAEDAIEDCEDATEAANDATDAANNAAESANDAASAANDAASAANTAANTLNTMLENIDEVPTQNSNNLVKSGGVYTALAGKQNTLTFDDSPTSGSNNPVKSGGIKTAIDAAEASASKKNVYLVKHAASTWQTSGSGVMTYEASTLDTAAELEAIEADSILATQVPSPDGASVVTLYECIHDVDVIYFRSEIIDHSYTIRAAIDISVDAPVIACIKRVDETPLLLHVNDITQSGGYNYVTFNFGEPALIYDGRYTRDMHILLQVIGDVDFASCVVLRKTVVKEQDQNSGHITSVSFESVGGNRTLNITAYYRDGVYQTAVYTIT